MLKPIHAGVASLAVCLSLSIPSLSRADEEGGEVQADESQGALEERHIGAARLAPVSSTAYTFDQLEVRSVHGLTDMIAGNSAGLLIQPSSFNSSSLGLSIRGIGATTPHQATGDSSVGVFIDGAYIARSQGLSLDLLDIGTVNVVRGAQPVLGGRNTTGGAVYLTSSKPTGEFGFEQKIQFGEIGDEFTSITHINLPKFADILSTKVSYLIHNHDGWVDNEDGENFWVRDNEGLRVAFRFDQDGPFTYDYSFLDAEIKSTAPYLQDLGSSSGFVDSASLPLGEADVDISHHSQTVSLRGDNATLTAVISYREVESKELAAFNPGADAAYRAANPSYPATSPIPPNIAFSDPSELDQQQFTQKLQLDTQLMDGALDLTLGLENFSEQVELSETDYQGNTEVNSFALYAQGIFNLTDTLELTLGWRETSEEEEIESLLFAGNASAARVDLDDDNTSFNVALSLELSETLRSFIAFKSGFKSGGASLYSSTLTGAGGSFTPYEAETMESIEVGVEGSLLDDMIDFSVVAFSNDIDDKQIALPDAANVRIADVVNLSESTTVEGAELELAVEIIEGLVFSGLYTYLDSETMMLSGTEVNAAGAPEHAGSAAIDWAIGDFEAGAVKLHLEYNGLGSYFFNGSNAQTGSRDVFNARLSASGFQLEDDSGTIEIGIWAHNLTDDEYLLNSEEIGGTVFGAFGEPRSYGVDFRYEI